MRLVLRGFLFWSCVRVNSTRAAVIAHPRNLGVVDHGRVVHIAHIGDVYIVDGLVVVEVVFSPVTAIITGPGIAVAVRNAAIEPDDRTPIAGMLVVQPATIGPIARGPQQAGLRGQSPGSGHPVIAIRPPPPVARRPDVAFARASRLGIDRQRRWPEVYGKKDLGRTDS